MRPMKLRTDTHIVQISAWAMPESDCNYFDVGVYCLFSNGKVARHSLRDGWIKISDVPADLFTLSPTEPPSTN